MALSLQSSDDLLHNDQGRTRMKLSPSEVQQEIEKVRTNGYQQFIKRVRLRNVRGGGRKN